MTANLSQDLDHCALPGALEAMGERWSFLILRAALSGVCHFEDFQARLGIARNILANRLSRAVENGIMVRTPMTCDRRKVEYRLTEKGKDLAPAMIALRQWGEKWGCAPPNCQTLADNRDRLPIRGVVVQAHDGRELQLSDLVWICNEDATPVDTADVEAVA